MNRPKTKNITEHENSSELENNNKATAAENSTDHENNKATVVAMKQSKSKRLLLLLVPYLTGLVWHTLHPFASVLTGHLDQPRKWYIDENSLEPSYFQMNVPYDVVKQQQRDKPQISGLCEAVMATDVDAISCFPHQDFEMARILPTMGAIAPVTEALVLVIPTTDNWAVSQFHVSVVQLIHRLSLSTWLAKTVLVVTPTNNNTPLSDTVDVFLETYLGSNNHNNKKYSPLPARFTGAILRNLIVLNVTTGNKSGSNNNGEIQILPQGRRGVLPNMDLTFMVMYVYSRTNIITRKRGVLVMHPFQQQLDEFWKWMQPRLAVPDGARKLLELLGFEYSLAMGPYPPHASALDRGIDSLTIQAYGPTKKDVADMVQKMEMVLRSLSNLHERLHHSTSLYLLASPERFVKHEEYLIPNLLLLVPLVVRAISLVLLNTDLRFCWSACQWALQWTVMGTIWCSVAAKGFILLDYPWTDRIMTTCSIGLFYLVMLLSWLRSGDKRGGDVAQSIQFLACLWALVVHVPLAFGHVSLAFPSALVWTPLIAFPSHLVPPQDDVSTTSNRVRTLFGWMGWLLSLGLVLVTCPCIFLVPFVFPEYTTYVRYGYLPLHLLWTSLVIASRRRLC